MSRMDGPKAPFNSVLTILAVGWWALCPGQAWAQAVLATNPTSVDFGDQRVGVESDAKSLSVHNIGDDTATDVLCSVTDRPGGNDPEAFSISGCPTTLAAGASFETDISFLPTSVGPKGAQLLVFYDYGTAATDVSVDLDGVGIDGPDLSVNGDWSDIEIGQQHVSAGATDPAIQVTMRNQHTAFALTIVAFNLIGASCSEFAFGFPGPTPLTISAGTTDYFSVTFDPSEQGVKACEVMFVSNDPDPPDTVMVTGTGTNQTVEVTPSGYDFGAVDVSGGAVAKDFFIVNDGDLGDLIVSSLSLYGATCGAFSLIGVPTTPFNISPGDIETVTVAFDPPVAGGYDCDIEIPSNDAGTPTLNIPLVGTGIELEPIFADGFESGTTDSWSVVAP